LDKFKHSTQSDTMDGTSINAILNDWIWEFKLVKPGQQELKLIKIFHTNSLTFNDVEVIEQWNFVIPESEIVCYDRNKLSRIRNQQDIEFQALMNNGKVLIE